MKEIEAEKLKQIISRTDKSGNEKVAMLIEFAEAYAAQQSKMPTREECDKKMFEILSQPTSLGKDLRGVRSPAMMMAEYSEWLRNQIEKGE